MLSRLAGVSLPKQGFAPLVNIVRLRYTPPDDVDIHNPELYKTHRITLEKIVSEENGGILNGPVTTIEGPVPHPLPFNGPQRDHVNFPHVSIPDFPAPTRLALIPETWFQFLYPKLGVTGPYTLLIGLYLFLVQKELLITDDHDWKHALAYFGWVYIFCRSELGKKFQEFWEKPELEGREKEAEFEKLSVDIRKEAIATEKKEQWRMEGKNLLYEAKKENVKLQLEAVYRENAMDIYNKVKRRLDYLVEVGNIDTRVKQKYMVDWVIDQVKQSIAKTSEKDTMNQCIRDLNALAARA